MKLICEIFKILSSAMIGSIVAMVLFLDGIVFSKHSTPLDAQISYENMASINLTVATIILAAVALIIAIGAIFGYQAIRSSLIEAAQSVVCNQLPILLRKELDEMQTSGKFSEEVETAVYGKIMNEGDAYSEE